MNRTGSSMGYANVKNDRYNARYQNGSEKYDDLEDDSSISESNEGDLNRASIEN